MRIARAGPPSIHAAGFAGVAALLLLAAAALPVDAPALALFACPFRTATGWPCLGCGFTHAFQFVVRGHLGAAFAVSPLGTLLALLGAAHAAWTALRFAGFPWAPSMVPGARMRWACAFALAANWIFVAFRNRP